MANKIIYRTDRWHDFLSRETRGLAIAAPSDTVADKFCDEVFSRIYSGDEPIAAADVPERAFAAWANRYHAALSKSRAFQQIIAQCKGSALRSAIAIDKILSEVRPEPEASKPPPPPKPPPGPQPEGQPGAGEPQDGEGEQGQPGEGEPGEKGKPKKGQNGGKPQESKPEPGEGEGGEGAGSEPGGDEPVDAPERKPDGEPEPGDEGEPGGEQDSPSNGYGTGQDVTQGEQEVDININAAELERALSVAAEEAEEEAEDVEKAIRALAGAGVRLDQQGEVLPGDVQKAREMAKDLKLDPRLRAIVDLAGKMKAVAKQKRLSKAHGGNEKTIGVEAGDDVMKLLPQEVARLADDELSDGFFADYAEHRTLQFKKETRLQQGHGPIVMLLDKSSSMGGPPDQWQSAIALAMLEHAKKARRTFAIMGFGGHILYKKIVAPNEPLPVDVILRNAAAGSTDIGAALTGALDLIAEHQKAGGKLSKADIILITDGDSYPGNAHLIRERATKLDTSIIALGIGTPPAKLKPWTNDVRAVESLAKIDDEIATSLFSPKSDEPKKKGGK